MAARVSERILQVSLRMLQLSLDGMIHDLSLSLGQRLATFPDFTASEQHIRATRGDFKPPRAAMLSISAALRYERTEIDSMHAIG
jgi:hypothetical protein